jgi:DNA segregation ATPase FtsK/SpoIIIE-like protein
MKIIKVKDQYYNLNQYQQFSINDGILILSSALNGSFSKSYNSSFEDNNDINLDSELIFRILDSTNQMEFMKQFDQFLTGPNNLMDCSSLIEIYTYDEAENSRVEGIENLVIDQDTFRAAKIVIEEQNGSASIIQRKLKLGYNRAGRIIDQLEELGIIGPFNGSSARLVNITDLGALDAHLENLGVKIEDTIE